MDEAPVSITPQSLYRRIASELAPIVVDLREAPDFAADEWMIVGAIRRSPEAAADWRAELPASQPLVVYGAKSGEVGRTAGAALRENGGEARHLEGGIEAWRDAGLPLHRKLGEPGAAWVTRERPKIDRIACPWLIRRFIDPEAHFLFAPTERVFAVAAEKGATAFDIPGAEPFSHVGPQCSFDAFLEVYGIADRALDVLADIVRGADTARLELTPQSPGLLALSLGLAAIYADDHAMLERGMILYDALYAWCRDCRGEGHDWNPAAMAARA
jgi:rhodanese-related sulfurtransferase